MHSFDSRTGELSMVGGKTWKVKQELCAENWLNAFWRLDDEYGPFHVTIEGGEPTLYQGLDILLNNLPPSWTWSAITDCTKPAFPPKQAYRCTGLLVRFHLPLVDSKKTEYIDGLLGNVQDVSLTGYKISFLVVVTPGLMDKASDIVPLMRKHYPVIVNPAVLVPGLDWDLEPDGWCRARNIGGKFFSTMGTKFSQFPRFKLCTAGDEYYFAAMPDGQVFRCYSSLFWPDVQTEPSKSIGHIKTFEPTKLIAPCKGSHLYPFDTMWATMR